MFYSSNETMKELILSAGAGGYGAKIDASTSNKQSSSTITLTIDAYKSIYAIDALSAGDNEYFTELPSGVNANNLIIVNSVAYGSRILANLTIECKSSEDAVKLAASYSGFGFSANLGVSNVSKYTDKQVTLNYKQVGGPNKAGTMTVNVTDLQRKIDEILNMTTYANAVPVSYNVRDLAGNNMGIQSTVDKYTETLCATNAYVKGATVKIKNGKDGKNDDNYVFYRLYSSREEKDKTRCNQIPNPIAYQPGQPKTIEGCTGILQYSQPRKEEYKGYTTVGSYQLTEITPSRKTYMKNLMEDGGYLEIYTNHKGGKDDWDIDQVQLTIEFSDGTASKPLIWTNPKRITRDNNSIKLLFGETLQPK